MTDEMDELDDSFEEIKEVGKSEEDYVLITNNIRSKLIRIQCIELNQNKNWVGIGTNFGLRVYLLEKMKLFIKKEGNEFIMESGINHLHFLFNTFLIFLIPDGKNPKFSNTQIYLYDCKTNEILKKFSCFYPINKFFAFKDYLVVSIEGKFSRISIIKISLSKPIKSFLTSNEINKIFSVNSLNENLILAYIKSQNIISIYNLLSDFEYSIKIDFPSIQKICLNSKGNKLAVSNFEGTYISIYSIGNKEKIIDLYRGRNSCNIKEMIFSENDKYLIIYSDRETFHIYNISKKDDVYSLLPTGLTNIMQGKYLVSFAKYSFFKEKKEKVFGEFEESANNFIDITIHIDDIKNNLMIIKDSGDYEKFELFEEKANPLELIEKKTWLNKSEIIENALNSLVNVLQKSLIRNMGFNN